MGALLETETAFFEGQRKHWVEQGHEREFAVVHGESLLGFFESLGEAYDAGASQFGAGNFLAKKVTPEDEVEIVHRVQLRPSGT